MVQLLRALAGRLRRWLEGTLHPARRASAERHLRATGMPRHVLVVCHGNICRSPYAAAAIRRALDAVGANGVGVSSAGFIGPGRRADESARLAARRRGIDLDSHVSRLIPTTMPSLVVVMDARQRRALGDRGEQVVILGDLDPDPIQTRTIVDPYGQPESVFEEVYTRIDRCVAQLVRVLRA